jgi:hypothetical protein
MVCREEADFLRAAIEVLLIVVGYFRFLIRRRRSRSWPAAQGVVQVCGVELNSLAPYRYRSVFGYAFKADGSRYAGFFVLATDDEDSATALQKQAPGTTVTVRYNRTTRTFPPTRPKLVSNSDKSRWTNALYGGQV